MAASDNVKMKGRCYFDEILVAGHRLIPLTKGQYRWKCFYLTSQWHCQKQWWLRTRTRARACVIRVKNKIVRVKIKYTWHFWLANTWHFVWSSCKEVGSPSCLSQGEGHQNHSHLAYWHRRMYRWDLCSQKAAMLLFGSCSELRFESDPSVFVVWHIEVRTIWHPPSRWHFQMQFL